MSYRKKIKMYLLPITLFSEFKSGRAQHRDNTGSPVKSLQTDFRPLTTAKGNSSKMQEDRGV